MKHILSTVIVLIFVINLNLRAQSLLQFDADSVSTEVNATHSENELPNYYKNNSSGTLATRWEKEIIILPKQWSIPQICDNNLCYGPAVFSKTVNLDAGQKSLLKIVAQPNSQDSCALIKMTIRIDGTNEILDQAYYYYISRGCEFNVASSKTLRLENLNVYPNPSSDYIQLSNTKLIKELKIYNASGNILDQYYNYNKGLIDVKRYSNGNYYIISTYADGKMGISKFIVY